MGDFINFLFKRDRSVRPCFISVVVSVIVTVTVDGAAAIETTPTLLRS